VNPWLDRLKQAQSGDSYSAGSPVASQGRLSPLYHLVGGDPGPQCHALDQWQTPAGRWSYRPCLIQAGDPHRGCPGLERGAGHGCVGGSRRPPTERMAHGDPSLYAGGGQAPDLDPLRHSGRDIRVGPCRQGALPGPRGEGTAREGCMMAGLSSPSLSAWAPVSTGASGAFPVRGASPVVSETMTLVSEMPASSAVGNARRFLREDMCDGRYARAG